MTTYYSPNLYGTPALEPVDAPGAPVATPEPAGQGERTAAQVARGAVDYARSLGLNVAYAGMVASGCRPDGRPVILPGTYATYRAMIRQPTIALGLAAANAPVKAAAWSWQSKEPPELADGEEPDPGAKYAPDGALDYLRDLIDPAQPFIVRECLRSRVFGFQAFEKVFREGGEFQKLKPLLPELTVIRYSEATGAFAGLRNLAGKRTDGGRPGTVLSLESCFLFTHDKEGDDHYGMPLLENSREAFSYWLASVDNKFRAQRKISGVIVQLHYPPGKSLVNGVLKDNSEIAQEVLQNVGKTNSVAMPNNWAAEDRGAMADTNGGKPQWILSTVDAGEGGSGLDAISNDAKYWDVMMLRGLLVPERAVTEGQFGTKAEAEAHGDILLTVGQELADDIARAVNWHLIDHLLALRYGEDARGTVWVEPTPLTDDSKSFYREFVKELMQDPGVRFDVRRSVQLRPMLEAMGLKLAEWNNVDEEMADAATAPLPPVSLDSLLPAKPAEGEEPAGTNGDGMALARLNGRGLDGITLGDFLDGIGGIVVDKRLAADEVSEELGMSLAADRRRNTPGAYYSLAMTSTSKRDGDGDGKVSDTRGRDVVPVARPLSEPAGARTVKEGWDEGHDDVVDPRSIIPLHGVEDPDKLNALVDRMKASGWQGRPVLVEETADGYQGLTGSHRVAAAREAGVEVPIVKVNQEALRSFLESEGFEDATGLLEYMNRVGGVDDDVILHNLKQFDPRAARLMRAEIAANRAGRL